MKDRLALFAAAMLVFLISSSALRHGHWSLTTVSVTFLSGWVSWRMAAAITAPRTQRIRRTLARLADNAASWLEV